jgi:LPXTG-motif cell wall-anchored protein
MNLHSLIPSRMALAITCGIALAAGIATSPARADQWDKKTILTVNQPIQVTDTVLEPGQYVLKLLDSQSDRHIVQILNSNQTHVVNTVLAIPRERVLPTGKTEFTFWETPPGSYRALRTWFYPGDSYGQEFAYPKHLQQMAMLTSPATLPLAPEPAAEPVPAPAESTAQSEPTAQSEATTPEPSPEQPVEVAQNTAPAPDQAPAETPAHSTPEQPAQLPTTGSPYPAVGMSGALLLGLAGLLRLRRQA